MRIWTGETGERVRALDCSSYGVLARLGVKVYTMDQLKHFMDVVRTRRYEDGLEGRSKLMTRCL